MFLKKRVAVGLPAFHKTATLERPGRVSLRSSNLFGLRSPLMVVRPVTVAARPGEAGDQAERIDNPGEDDRDCSGRRLRGLRGRCVYRNDNVDIETDQFGGEAGKPFRPRFCKSILDQNAPLETAEVAEGLPERVQQRRRFGGAT